MSDAASKFRQQLHQKLSELERILKPAFEPSPVFPGAVHVSAHRCGKPQGHCQSGG